MKKKILYVEDDDVIRQNYSEILTSEGYDVLAFDNAQDALDSFQRCSPDIAILDINLGGIRNAGYRLCAQLRRFSDLTPIIFLTCYGSDIDKVSGIRLGADDYLTKDTSIDYLIARIDALLARAEILSLAVASDEGDIYVLNELSIHKKKYEASWKSSVLDISLTQFWILQELALNAGEIKSANQLMEAASILVEPNTIAAHIKSIRRQFRKIDDSFNLIKTEYATGYRWLL